MKNKFFIIISILFLSMRVSYAGNKLLDYFHEGDFRMLHSLFHFTHDSISYVAIPSNIAHHYLDLSKNFNEDHYIPTKNTKYYSHAKIKMDGFWILCYSTYNNNIINSYIATYDEEKDDVIARIHIARWLNYIELGLRYFIYYNDQPIIKITKEFPCSIEGEPTLLHETYRLDKTLTLIEYDEIAWDNNYLTYKTINAELEENSIDDMSEEEFLNLFKTYSKLSEIPFNFDAYFEDIPAGSTLIPNNVYLSYLFPCKNEYKYEENTRYPLSYYAIGKVWTGNCWLLIYRLFNSIHYTDLYISSYSKGIHKPDATLLLYGYYNVECKLYDRSVQLTYKYRQWPQLSKQTHKETRLLNKYFSLKTKK